MVVKEKIRMEGGEIPPINLDLLFHPRSIAIVGASKDKEKGGGRFTNALQRFNYDGKIFPINPKESEILGLRTFPSVLAIEDEIDMAIIAIPAGIVPSVIRECGQKRVKFAVIHTAGFAELGDEGAKLQRQIVELARESNVRIVGPNCMGVFCAEKKVASLFSYKPDILEKGDVSLFSQSGTIFNVITKLCFDRGLKLDKAVSVGNQADLRDIDYLWYFGQDPDTRVIIAYLEGLNRGREFIKLAKEISLRKPIIIWKVGGTEAGVRAAISHTAAMITSDSLCDSAFKQAGILRAKDSEELCDIAVAFSSPYLPAGKRTGLLVDSGGQGVILADACAKAGLELTVFPPEIQSELRLFLTGIIPPFSGLANPVDLVWPNYNEILKIYKGCLEIMAKVVDAIIMYSFYPYDENVTGPLQELRDRLKIPIFIIPAYHISTQETLQKFIRKGFPAFPTAERSAAAMAALVNYGEYRRQVNKERLE